MTKQPGPLMDFNDQPQQRLYAVPDIPYELFDEKIEFREVGNSGVPKKIPSRAKFVIQVEWAWTPMHNRLTNYHISLDSERRRWVPGFWCEGGGIARTWLCTTEVGSTSIGAGYSGLASAR